MKRFAFGLFCSLIIAVGCHAQVPPATNHVVTLSWTAPTPSGNWAGCTTTAPCVYAVYRCTTSLSSCSSTSNSGWTEITTSSTRPSGTTFTDATASGLTANYAVETVQGSANSSPSNVVTVAVPGSPIAPSLSNPTAAENVTPQIVRPALPQLASLPAEIHLTARIAGR